MDISLYQLKEIISEMTEVGYMRAIRQYEPTEDEITQREVIRWFKILGIEPSMLTRMENEGIVKGKRKGMGKNSPKYYSKVGIKEALASLKINKYLFNK